MSKVITKQELVKFFDGDDAEDIAAYMATNMNQLAEGSITVEEFIEMHKPEEE